MNPCPQCGHQMSHGTMFPDTGGICLRCRYGIVPPHPSGAYQVIAEPCKDCSSTIKHQLTHGEVCACCSRPTKIRPLTPVADSLIDQLRKQGLKCR